MSSGPWKAQTFSFSQTLHMDSIHGPAVNKEIGFRHCLRQGETNLLPLPVPVNSWWYHQKYSLTNKAATRQDIYQSIFCQCTDLAQIRQHNPVRPMLSNGAYIKSVHLTTAIAPSPQHSGRCLWGLPASQRQHRGRVPTQFCWGSHWLWKLSGDQDGSL